MKTMLRIVALVIFVAGCSGQASFEREILGEPPSAPPPATAAGSNVAARPAERDPGTAPVAGEAAQKPSVSTTHPQETVPAHTPVPAVQTTPAQTASPYAAPVQTASPYTAPAQTASPYAKPAPVQPAQAAPVVKAPAGAASGRGPLVFQVGSFAHEANAVSLRDVIVTRGHESYVEQGRTNQGKVFYRVYAKMKGNEAEARAALDALGVSEPRLVSGAGAAVSQPAAPVPAGSGTPVAPAPAVAPVKPPVSATTAAASAVIPGPTGDCHVDAERISTIGTGKADPAQPLMAQKAAAQNAKRNLLLCVDAYKRKLEKIPSSIKMEGYLPETLVTYTSPAYLADGTVEVGASMAVRDVDAVAFTRVD